jgi:SMC interacting uncharacterized protein involved in chromosome segregation
MREVNQFIVQKHFKMEEIPTIEDFLRKNKFAISFDLKETYNPTLQDLLEVQFMGLYL